MICDIKSWNRKFLWNICIIIVICKVLCIPYLNNIPWCIYFQIFILCMCISSRCVTFLWGVHVFQVQTPIDILCIFDRLGVSYYWKYCPYTADLSFEDKFDVKQTYAFMCSYIHTSCLWPVFSMFLWCCWGGGMEWALTHWNIVYNIVTGFYSHYLPKTVSITCQ